MVIIMLVIGFWMISRLAVDYKGFDKAAEAQYNRERAIIVMVGYLIVGITANFV